MSRRSSAAIAALLLAAAARKPTNAALRKAFENNAQAVVEVVGPHQSGPGVVVDVAPATPDAGNAPGFHPPAVRLDETFQVGTELVAIARDQDGFLRPRLVEVSKGRKVDSPFVEVNASLPRGTPLFDAQGRLVALAVQRRKSSARALPVPEVKGQLAQAAGP